MADLNSERVKGERVKDAQAVVAYSLSASIALDLAIAFIAFGYGVYLLLWGGAPPYPWAASFLFLGDFYIRLWRRPVRQARFFEDHFEVVGYGVKLNGRYDQVEDLKKTRALVGDFSTDSRVWFSVKDDPNILVLPNRRDRRRKIDLYSWLHERSKDTSSER